MERLRDASVRLKEEYEHKMELERWLEHASVCTLFSHTHLFNGPLYGTTRVSRYRKGKTNLDGIVVVAVDMLHYVWIAIDVSDFTVGCS